MRRGGIPRGTPRAASLAARGNGAPVYDGERIYVGATKAEAQARGWDVEPGMRTVTEADADAALASEATDG